MLHFGTAGRPLSTKGKASADGIRRVRELGLSCMELEWVRSAPEHTSKTLEKSKQASLEEPEIILSCHASYYINLAGSDDIVSASKERIIKATKSLAAAGGRNVVFHPGFYKSRGPEIVHEIIRDNMIDIVSMLDSEGISGYTLRPETTGKATQYGSLEEIIKLSCEVPNTAPCIDFAHLHSRSAGKCNTYSEFKEIFNDLKKGLGDKVLSDMHIHLSGIEYTDKGERKHLPLEESDMNFKDLLKVFKEFNISGTLICESPIIEEDAILMKNYFESL